MISYCKNWDGSSDKLCSFRIQFYKSATQHCGNILNVSFCNNHNSVIDLPSNALSSSISCHTGPNWNTINAYQATKHTLFITKPLTQPWEKLVCKTNHHFHKTHGLSYASFDFWSPKCSRPSFSTNTVREITLAHLGEFRCLLVVNRSINELLIFLWYNNKPNITLSYTERHFNLP